LIADRALARNTGARALRAVVDEIMIDLMYHLPELDNANAVYTIDARSIERGVPLQQLRRRERESA
jgi:ATP-dependent Clp protease ATP-binding subunit ClpX